MLVCMPALLAPLPELYEPRSPKLPLDRAPNCGARSTWANPDFATWWFTDFKSLTAPRGTPNPADPRVIVRWVGNTGESTGPPFPTTTVLTVPVGATGAWKLAADAPTYRGTVAKLFQLPGCHIQPMPGTIAQLP